MKKINFTSSFIWAEGDKSIHPKEAINYLPEWLKKTPPQIENNSKIKLLPKIRTVKKCPSFSDIYKEGVILVAPYDIWLSVRFENNKKIAEWKTPHKELELDIHSEKQMIDHLPKEANIKTVFKLLYPFKCITPAGYSIRQMPLHYHFNNDWYVPYGVINTDVHHEVNLQIMYISDSEEVLIKKGTPMVHVIPFKRSDRLKLKILNYTDKLHKKVVASNFFIFTVFKNGYSKHEYNKK